MNGPVRGRRTSTSTFLVAVQVVASASIVLATQISLSHLPGFAIAIAGISLGAWAIATIGFRRVSVMPELKPGADLVTHGPYRFVRHPMYTALLLLTGGLVISPLAAWKCPVWGILFAVLLAKSKIEERDLRQQFSAYNEYSHRTKRFVPFLF